MNDCRYPFAHSPDECTCQPSPTQIALRVADQNARAWAGKRREDRITIAGLGIIIFIASLGFLAAAEWGLSRAETAYQQARV